MEEVIKAIETSNKTFQIAEHYGLANQTEQLVEEMAELIVEIKHSKREEKVDFSNLLKELADVEFMLEQVIFLLGCRDEIRAIKRKNADKMMEVIAKEKEHGIFPNSL